MRREANERFGPVLVDLEEGVEDRCHEDGASGVWFFALEVVARRWRVANPTLLFVEGADRVPERATVTDRFPELDGQSAEETGAFEIAASLRELDFESLGDREVLEESDDVGECFVEGEGVGIARGLVESM